MHGRRVPLLILCVICALVWGAGAALAQQGGGAKFSLEECRRMALANNLDLVSAKRDPEIAEQRVEVSRAPFDPVLGAGGTFNRDEQDDVITTVDTDPITGMTMINTGPADSETDSFSGDVSFAQALNFGGNYTVTYNYSDVDFGGVSVQGATGFITDTTFTQESDSVRLDYSMPLLSGFGKEVNTEALILARGNLGISMQDLRLSAIQTIQSVENAYWDLLAANESLRISKLALTRAEDLLELNRKKVEVGTLAPIEITEAEAGVASQVEAVIVAENSVENAEDVLLELLAISDDSPLWEQSIELTDTPSFVPADIDLDSAIREALDARPEMESARQRVRNAELSERVAKRRVKHGLELNASVTPTGNDDTARLVQTLNPPNIPDSDSDTASDTLNWSVGLRWSLPLRNRDAKANSAIARLQSDKDRLGLQSTTQSVRVSVRTAVRNLESDMQRVEAARKNVVLQQKKLEAEEKKYDNGMSTSFEVLTFQNDLADAELAEIRARLDYLKSLTELERAKGTLLRARGLSLPSRGR